MISKVNEGPSRGLRQEFKLVYCFYLFIVYTDFVCVIALVFTIANVHNVILFKIPSQKFWLVPISGIARSFSKFQGNSRLIVSDVEHLMVIRVHWQVRFYKQG